jgi:hypothetical protein
MDIVASGQLLLLLSVCATGVTLLLGVLVIAVRARKIREQLLELDALRCSVQAIQSKLTEIDGTLVRTFVGLQALSGVGLHFREIKREQLRLCEKLSKISSTMQGFGKSPQLGDEPAKQSEEIKEIVEVSRSLQEWRSRVTAVYSDAGHLFDSEPIRELLDQFALSPESYTAEPPARSEGRRRPSQKRVRPRRQR